MPSARVLMVGGSNVCQVTAELRQASYAVEEVTGGEAALEAILERRPDVVVADLRAGQPDTPGLLAALRAYPRTGELPVIVVVAPSGVDGPADAWPAGADYYLVTPVSASELLASVGRHLRAGRRRAALAQGEQAARAEAQAALEAAPVMVWQAGLDKGCIYFNRPWLDFTGRTLDQELGDGWAEGVHPEDMARCLEIYVTAFDARREFEMEYRLRRHDGAYRWILDRGKPILMPDGGFLGYIGGCIDITDRKQAAAQRERLLLEGVRGYAIVWLTPTGEVASWTAAAQEVTGYRAEEIIGQSFSRFHTPEDQRRCRPEQLLRVAAAQGRAEDESWRVRKDGSRFWASVVLTALRDDAGQLQGFAKVTRDMTQRKRAEDQLRQDAADLARMYAEQAENLRRLEQLRGQLAAEERERLLDDERRRIARDLHDHAEQTFAAIGLAAALAVSRLPADRLAQPEVAALTQVSELSLTGAEQLREAIFALSHAEAVGRGLVPAMWRLVHAFQERTSIEADLVVTGPQGALPTEVAETLYAVAREALSNVERHSLARAVVLGLHMNRRSTWLSIQDDGTGPSGPVLKRTTTSSTHVGLGDMAQRVRRLGGTFVARRGPDGGFLVRARLPLVRPPTSGRR